MVNGRSKEMNLNWVSIDKKQIQGLVQERNTYRQLLELCVPILNKDANSAELINKIKYNLSKFAK